MSSICILCCLLVVLVLLHSGVQCILFQAVLISGIGKIYNIVLMKTSTIIRGISHSFLNIAGHPLTVDDPNPPSVG